MSTNRKLNPVEFARSYWDAESERDLPGVLAHYSPDAYFLHPGGRLEGHAQIGSYYEQSAARFPGLEVVIVGSVVNGPHAAIEWTATMIDPEGNRKPMSGVNVIKLRDGLFEYVRAYFDPSTLDG